MSELDNLEALDELMKVKAAVHVGGVGQKMAMDQDDMQTKWNEKYQVELCNMAQAHINYVIFKTFRDEIVKSDPSHGVRTALEDVCKLFAIHSLYESHSALFMSGFIKPAQLSFINDYYL